MKSFFRVARLVAQFGQLGFTLITPPVVLLLLGWWLQRRYALGAWVMVVALLIGLITSGVSAYKFYLRVIAPEKKRTEKEQPTEKPVVFYTHE